MEQEHGAEKETDDEEDKENDVHVPTDPQQPDRDGQDRRGRKRKLITKEQLRIANKETSSKKKNKASTCSSKKNKNKEINSKKKTNKSKKDEEVFIVRIGRSPLRTIPQNVINSTEDEIRKNLVPYAGQDIELFHSDDETDQFMRCCETVEKESGSAGQNATETEVRQPIHYTGGAKEMELEMSIGSLRETVRINQEMQNKVCDELREEITVVQSKLSESNKTLSLILAKLICPTKFQADGFRAPEMPPSSHTTHPTTATHQITDQIHQATVTLPSTTATHVTTQQAMNHTQQAAVTLPTTAIHVTTQQAMNQALQATVTLPTTATHVTTQQAMNQALQTTVTLPTTATHVTTIPTTATHVTTTNQATVTHPTTATQQATHETTATNQAADQASATGQADESISFNDSLLSPSPVYMEHDIPVNYEIVEAVEETPGILNSKIIANIKKNSCSRKNFAANLNEELFDEETRKRSNCSGTKPKLKLNPVLVDYIRSICFQHWPREENEKNSDDGQLWKECKIAIDEKNRRLNNKPRKNAVKA